MSAEQTSDALLQLLLHGNASNVNSDDLNLSSTDAQSYLAQLTALNVEGLAAEPARLAAEAVLIKSKKKKKKKKKKSKRKAISKLDFFFFFFFSKQKKRSNGTIGI
jgi:hypothetical protein